MKLQSEIIWIGIILIISSIVIVITLYYISQLSTKSQYFHRFSVIDDLALKTLASVYTAKLPTLEKTYLQTSIDALLTLNKWKESEREKVKEDLGLGKIVYYGMALGAYNSSDLLYPMLDNMIGKERWQLVIYKNQSLYEIYGYNLKPSETIKSYVLPIPMPDEEIGYLILRIS
ncbi:MAG: hypothetical protein QXP34_01535 [Candidatus Aenigmatarchaeota archaeon]